MKYNIALATFAVLSATSVSAQTADRTKAYIDAGFATMDANKDGKVDRAEFDRFMRARLARQAATFNSGFAQLDRDANGSISKAEAAANQQLAENFAQVDTNRSGSISKEELRAAMIAAQANEIGAK